MNVTSIDLSVILNKRQGAENMSPGAAKRGSDGSVTTSRAILTSASAAPSAFAVAATAMSRAVPENSGTSSVTVQRPCASDFARAVTQSVRKRCACTGLRLFAIFIMREAIAASISGDAPPPAVSSGVAGFSGASIEP